jgi:hypothetical protein
MVEAAWQAPAAVLFQVPALYCPVGWVVFSLVQSLPADFLTTMEEYVRDAPKVGCVATD